MANFDVAQLAHVELYSPKPEETLKFFTDYLGLQVSAREGQSVDRRAYEDFYHHTLKITEAKEAGMAHTAWRASSEAQCIGRQKHFKEVVTGRDGSTVIQDMGRLTSS